MNSLQHNLFYSKHANNAIDKNNQQHRSTLKCNTIKKRPTNNMKIKAHKTKCNCVICLVCFGTLKIREIEIILISVSI